MSWNQVNVIVGIPHLVVRHVKHRHLLILYVVESLLVVGLVYLVGRHWIILVMSYPFTLTVAGNPKRDLIYGDVPRLIPV